MSLLSKKVNHKGTLSEDVYRMPERSWECVKNLEDRTPSGNRLSVSGLFTPSSRPFPGTYFAFIIDLRRRHSEFLIAADGLTFGDFLNMDSVLEEPELRRASALHGVKPVTTDLTHTVMRHQKSLNFLHPTYVPNVNGMDLRSDEH